MSYQQITINVNDAVPNAFADALMEHGALSAAIEDAYAGTENEQAIFGEPGIADRANWQQKQSHRPFSAKATTPLPLSKPPRRNAV